MFCELGNHIFQIMDPVAASKLRDLTNTYEATLYLGTGAGHTRRTHEQFYANDHSINDAGLEQALARALQQVLGCYYEEQSTHDVHTHRGVSDGRLQDCLRQLGHTDFRRGQLDAQKWMHNPQEGTPKHYLFVVSPTGTGKSLLWELFPLVNERERKTAVIISPTISLSLACAAKAEERYRSHGLNYTVVTEYLDYHQHQRPDLIFLSVSAFSKVYESICKDPRIACIFVDEFQFIVSDFEFRANDWLGVQKLPLLAPSHGFELVFSTASFPLHGRDDIYTMLDILDQKCVDLYYDDKCDVMSQHMHRIRVHNVQEEISEVFHMLHGNENSGYITHVICQTVHGAKTLYNHLTTLQRGLITGSCDPMAVKDVLSRWTKRQISTLITTSTAVAGIDSSHVNRVIFFGLPYSLMYVHQGVGRLRKPGVVEFVVGIPENEDLNDVSSVSPSIFCDKIVKKWLLDQSCRWKSFNYLFSGKSTNVCNRCDVCTSSDIYRTLRSLSHEMMEEQV